ncbi:TetR/AcrR family transcriptional regulator [Caballeronia zhejiangensis]|uniref:TetR/AcrR family transcriptional regulator n=1 Tax=Caballeronia zhejiangensis TaxID=871203 RepID=UPI001F5286EC|nr:TetR/AcrR family transcriptional regulator [Caballeronia zhejiangensis]MCI1047027.1 TetR family transcriptional regulator [Caballeronia zhejiangensis]
MHQNVCSASGNYRRRGWADLAYHESYSECSTKFTRAMDIKSNGTMFVETKVRGTSVKRTRKFKSADRTRDTLLAAAEHVFARFGYDGATVERISKQAKCFESLIYYHFGNKERLFVAVLQENYRRLIEAEQALELDIADPSGALRQIVNFYWTYYQKHPELITLLNTENMQRGKHLAKASSMSELLRPALSILEEVLNAGVSRKIFRRDLDSVDVYLAIMSSAYFYMSNRYTLSAFLSRDLMSSEQREHWGAQIEELVVRFVQA